MLGTPTSIPLGEPSWHFSFILISECPNVVIGSVLRLKGLDLQPDSVVMVPAINCPGHSATTSAPEFCRCLMDMILQIALSATIPLEIYNFRPQSLGISINSCWEHFRETLSGTKEDSTITAAHNPTLCTDFNTLLVHILEMTFMFPCVIWLSI